MASYPLPDKLKPLLPYNWKNEADYAYTKNHSLRQWSWEFLRRNKDYQKDWLVAARKLKTRLGQQHSRRINTIPDIFESKEAYKWGISQFIDPRTTDLRFSAIAGTKTLAKNIEIFAQNMNYFSPWETLIYGDEAHRLLKGLPVSDMDIERHITLPHLAISIFDLTRSADIQSKILKENMIKIQKEKKIKVSSTRSRSKNKNLDSFKQGVPLYCHYVRILDAIETGIRPKEIKDILFENYDDKADDKYRRYKNAAEKLVDERCFVLRDLPATFPQK